MFREADLTKQELYSRCCKDNIEVGDDDSLCGSIESGKYDQETPGRNDSLCGSIESDEETPDRSK